MKDSYSLGVSVIEVVDVDHLVYVLLDLVDLYLELLVALAEFPVVLLDHDVVLLCVSRVAEALQLESHPCVMHGQIIHHVSYLLAQTFSDVHYFLMVLLEF